MSKTRRRWKHRPARFPDSPKHIAEPKPRLWNHRGKLSARFAHVQDSFMEAG